MTVGALRRHKGKPIFESYRIVIPKIPSKILNKNQFWNPIKEKLILFWVSKVDIKLIYLAILDAKSFFAGDEWSLWRGFVNNPSICFGRVRDPSARKNVILWVTGQTDAIMWYHVILLLKVQTSPKNNRLLDVSTAFWMYQPPFGCIKTS